MDLLATFKVAHETWRSPKSLVNFGEAGRPHLRKISLDHRTCRRRKKSCAFQAVKN